MTLKLSGTRVLGAGYRPPRSYPKAPPADNFQTGSGSLGGCDGSLARGSLCWQPNH